MSRIGKKPIEVPAGVIVSVDPGRVTVSGPKGELRQVVPARMQITQEEGDDHRRSSDRARRGSRAARADAHADREHGRGRHARASRRGSRSRASATAPRSRATNLELQVGYSHSVRITPREGIAFEVPVPTQVVVRGIDKQMVGQTAAEIRKVRPPEPYKGKGIRYEGEHVRRKVGKRA